MPRIAPRGITALLVLALIAYGLARASTWPLALAVTSGAFVALIALDMVLLRGAIEIVRIVPPRFSLARHDVLKYEITNRTPAARRVSLVEAPAERLAIELA